MEPVVAILTACLALIGGIAIGWATGWMLASRGGAGLRAERDRLDERSRAAETARATAEERASAAGLLRTTLDAVTQERDAAQRDLAAERAVATQRAEAIEARLEEQRRNREALSAQFAEIGGKLLGEAQKAFLERADQRFAQADEKSGERLKALLTPVETTLKRYEESVGKIEKARGEAYGRRRCVARRRGWSTRCAPRRKRAAAGASSSFATCWRPAGSPNTPISRWRCRSTPRTAGCGRTRSSACRAASVRW